MIRIKCGSCGTSKGLLFASDRNISLPDAEEKRLVKFGVAEYISTGEAEAHQNSSFDVQTADSAVEGENGSEGCFEAMTVKELECYAEENGIDISGLKKKADIIQAITSAEAIIVIPTGEDAVV